MVVRKLSVSGDQGLDELRLTLTRKSEFIGTPCCRKEHETFKVCIYLDKRTNVLCGFLKIWWAFQSWMCCCYLQELERDHVHAPVAVLAPNKVTAFWLRDHRLEMKVDLEDYEVWRGFAYTEIVGIKASDLARKTLWRFLFSERCVNTILASLQMSLRGVYNHI